MGHTLLGLGEIEYRLAGLVLVGFLLGALVAWILSRRASEGLREEMEELNWRLVNLERQVYERFTGNWEGPQTPQEDPGQAEATDEVEGLDLGQEALASPEVASGHGTQEQTQSLLLTGVAEAISPPAPSHRRVRVTKVLGMGKGEIKYQAFEGVEETPPIAGRPYRVRTDGEATIRTSPVLQVTFPYFQTRNSVYRIEVVEPEIPPPPGSATRLTAP